MSGGADLARRREQLIAQCEAQRADIASHVGALGGPIRLADRILNAINYLRRHPLALSASVAALAVAQRRGLLKWGQRALLVWRAWRALRAGRNAF